MHICVYFLIVFSLFEEIHWCIFGSLFLLFLSTIPTSGRFLDSRRNNDDSSRGLGDFVESTNGTMLRSPRHRLLEGPCMRTVHRLPACEKNHIFKSSASLFTKPSISRPGGLLNRELLHRVVCLVFVCVPVKCGIAYTLCISQAQRALK